MQGHRLHQSVALVEDSDHRDPLGHRSHARLAAGQRLACVRGLLLLLVRSLGTAGGERQRKQENAGAQHVYSGVQGW
jgi:hypothetical protein